MAMKLWIRIMMRCNMACSDCGQPIIKGSGAYHNVKNGKKVHVGCCEYQEQVEKKWRNNLLQSSRQNFS
jgi:hypothetical protein